MKIFLSLILSIILYADIKKEMLALYQNGKYAEACSIGFSNFKYNNKDEEYVSLYAFACLKSDYIDRLTVPIAMLKFSKEARSNSAYFSIILMQKKLLYHAMVDGYNLSNLNLPTTDYILSKVFDSYAELGVHKSRSFYLFKDSDDNNLTYKLYIKKSNKVYKMIIEEFYNSVAIKKHIYW